MAQKLKKGMEIVWQCTLLWLVVIDNIIMQQKSQNRTKLLHQSVWCLLLL